MDNTQKTPSWAAIVLWFIFFWPIGIYLLIKKLSTDKSATVTNNGKILLAIGIFFVLGAFIMLSSLINGESDKSTAVGGILFYGIGGVLMIYASIKQKETGERYKKYIDIVINQGQTTIENIASQMQLSYEDTVKDLQKMIEKGYFKNAHIDYQNHEIIVENNQKSEESNWGNDIAEKVIKCPNCGGNNVIRIGRVCECDFCGSPIQ